MKLTSYNKGYNSYFDFYLNRFNEDEDGFNRMIKNQKEVYTFFDTIEDEKMTYAYAKTKWSIAQVLQHVIDTERIFCYRALKIVREKNPKINPYDHEAYASAYKQNSKSSLLADYKNNREASISLFKTFDEEDLNKAVNQDHYQFKTGLIPFIFCGHELHHLDIIRTKYLP